MSSPTPSLPLWTAIPFAFYLLSIAVIPLAWGHFWEKNRNKFLFAVAASLPVVLFLAFSPSGQIHWLLDSAKEYAVFIALIATLFIITGGISLEGELAGTPLVNTVFMTAGALLASVIGTTGASMLLIRPLLRANEARERKVHLVVFFIFIVSNAGGLLTPLGDPPLFLGFLRGVPFLWTLRLFAPWALLNGVLLVLCNLVDQAIFNKEERERPGSQLEDVQKIKEPLRLRGGFNLLLLAAVTVLVFAVGSGTERFGLSENTQKAIQIAGLGVLAGLSLVCTPKTIRESNRFTWGPILEVSVIFVGIFVTMVPALKILELRGPEFGVIHPWQFFWASGALSSVLDNAPTYLTFSAAAVGVVNHLDPAAAIAPGNLGALTHHLGGATLLSAVSCGSVFMGANTYIGNGPNFMVKAIAEEYKIKMPSFFGYMAWSGAILIPLFILMTFLFFRPSA
jgi:Na+/H+ antiporter NhaD/arsenite permease-like protein